jgi:TRAP-type C4-dicarboxylate transport system permease small subunit
MRKGFLGGVGSISRLLNIIAGSSLVFLMLLTVADVFLRLFDRPIPGTYELVSFMGTLVYGLALPFTSWTRQHIFVDFFITKLPSRVIDGFNVTTRVVAMALFFWFGWNVVKYAAGLRGHGELSPVLHMPFYPFTYALGICCFVECVVLLCDIIKTFGRAYHE